MTPGGADSKTRPALEALVNTPTDPEAIAAVQALVAEQAGRDHVAAYLAELPSRESLLPNERHAALVLGNLLGGNGTYRAAALEVDITPEVGTDNPLRLVGYAGEHRLATVVQEPLRMQLLLLEDAEGAKMLFVTADLFGFGDELVAAVHAEARQWGIRPDAVLLNASHTHYVCGTVENVLPGLGGYDRAYAARLATLLAQMLEPLHASLEPCFVYTATADAQIGVNRRRSREDRVELAVNPDGPYRRSTPLLVVDFIESGRSLLLVNHGCHPTGLGKASVVSAGFLGYLRRYLLEHGVADVVMFAQGAGGTAKPLTVDENGPRFSSTIDDEVGNATTLAEAVLSVLQERLRAVSGPVFARAETVRLPLSTHQPDYAAFRDDEANLPLIREWGDYFARRDPSAIPTTLDLPVHIAALGEAALFVTLAGEPCAELVERIIASTDLPDGAFVLGYTNGLKAYLPSRQMLEEGGYECRGAITAYLLPTSLAVESEQVLIDAVAGHLAAWRRTEAASGHGRYHPLGRERDAFFCLSTGRCGTATLAKLLGHATNARVYHHPKPFLIEETRAAYHGEIPQEETFWRARGGVICDAWKDDLVFGELDHNMTPFAGAISRMLPRSKFLVLVRSPWEFVRSGMRRGYYRGHAWDAGRLFPEPSHPDAERWPSMTPFEKVCWLWNDTYRRIEETLTNIPADRYRLVRFEDLVADTAVSEELFSFLGLAGFDQEATRSVLGQRLNSQTTGDFPRPEAWSDAEHTILERECAEMIARFGYARPVAAIDDASRRDGTTTPAPAPSETDDDAPQRNRVSLASTPRILFLEQAGLSTGGHLDHVVAHYAETSRYLKTADVEEARAAVREADLVWLEWAGPLTAVATQQFAELREKPVICRLHGFEAFTDYPKKTNWDVVDHLILVAEHKRQILAGQLPNLATPQSVIRNGICVDRFSIAPGKQNTKNLVLLGHINPRKGLPLLLQFFHELLKQDPEYHLYIRGDWQDARYEMGARTMIRELGIAGSVTIVEEWIEDLNCWLADKSHILSFSLEESFHYAIGNGMAAGLKPVIHAWNESRDIWPNEFIFRNLDEFLALIRDERYEPARYRELLNDGGLTAERQLREIDAVVSQVWEAHGRGAVSGAAAVVADSSGDGSASPAPSVTPTGSTPARGIVDPDVLARYRVDRTRGIVLRDDEAVRDYMGLVQHLQQHHGEIPHAQLLDYLHFSFQKLLGPYFNTQQLPQVHVEAIRRVVERLRRDHGDDAQLQSQTAHGFIFEAYHLLAERISRSEERRTIEIADASETLSNAAATHEVRNLYRALKNAFEPLYTNRLLSLFVVHGSLSTLDFTRFSDADTQLFLTDDAFSSPEMVEEVAKLITRNNLYLTAFDRLQHHGFFVATDLDRLSYPEPFLPLETLRRATRIFGEAGQHFAVRELPYADRFAAWNMGHFFRQSYMAQQFPRNPFDVKRYLSRFSMLPVLYLELIERTYPYKGDVFRSWADHFPPDVWAPFHAVTAARTAWNPARGVSFPQGFHRQAFEFAERLLGQLNELVIADSAMEAAA